MSADVHGGGFADPALASGAAFRALMRAMAEPGVPRPLPLAADPPPPLSAALGTLALTLLDHDTPVCLDAEAPEALAWLRFHTGAPEAGAATAAFVLVTAPLDLPSLSAFAAGTADDPERSATLLIQVETLDGGPPLTVSGPGVAATATSFPAPLPPDFAARLATNAARYPLGVDLVLVAPGAVLGLPRTSRPVEKG